MLDTSIGPYDPYNYTVKFYKYFFRIDAVVRIMLRLNPTVVTQQTSAKDKISTKVILDSNLDFWINPDSDLDVCRIASKM